MKVFDISQEVFSCNVFPGDPSPEREIKLSISEGAVCNLTAFNMCAHNGTLGGSDGAPCRATLMKL